MMNSLIANEEAKSNLLKLLKSSLTDIALILISKYDLLRYNLCGV